VFDGFSGTPRHRMRVPMQMEGTAVIEGRIYCVAGREPSGRSRALAAYDLETGQPEWQRALKGRDAICALSAEAPHLLVLRGDGSVVTHALRDGAAVHETRIFVGDVGRACPFPGTPLLTDADSLTLFPWVRRPALSVVSYDRGTGKLRWEVPYEADIHPSKAVVVRRDGVLCVLISYPRDNVQNILVRLLDANTGKLLQEIEPEGLARANWIPSMVEGHGTLVIFGKSGASIFRAAP
jgi:outer membrane protein assembly factor BamB